MKKQHYTTTVELSKSPKEVFNRISDVSKWWSNDFEGSSVKLNDEFVICHTDQRLPTKGLFPGKRVRQDVSRAGIWLSRIGCSI